MKMKKTCIYNANIVLPNQVIKGYILIEGSRIAEVGESGFAGDYNQPDMAVVDAGGCYVMPGMIDIHSDAIEKEMQPRPNTLFPIHMAFYELEKKLAVSGITTMYHSLCLSDEWGVRDKDMVLRVISSIDRFRKTRSVINHRIHLRYELTFLDGLRILESMIREKRIDLMSYMDHSPGQGQFKDVEALKDFRSQSYGRKEKEINAFLDKTMERRAMIDWSRLVDLAKFARDKGIRLASHDDDTKEKINTLLACEGVISEFPVNLDIAVYARAKGIHVCVGAPNIIRGKSHSDNMRAIDAIANNAADIVCSDYLPGAMLPALFYLTGEGIKLTEAVKLVTLNPAEALGIACQVGTIDVGKYADLIIVDLHEDYPLVRQTLVSGSTVFQSDFHKFNNERFDQIC
ncbi:alpha-D-ribose 1-methylphosphonate 5-triphosphate diphosphatase [Pelotomaculum sp. PtaB.Bin117]|uniref:alpha-D-ribose 1-methylphosphonate 5-triphosphate diphosphatase n=1 Tax=Pelotomaculum sp. PtaB.Bin117 TaxID=1811694 RepID=UPI0009D1F953|nr:alpha-D-ribose 1-methylphosphonate 5-triphosphate diphosphatase [Pelotomaculum sp. PtaB.Bin117]OPX84951.1 MAG: Alpha-D-ribose 1-methylphosphonate 5-triphosphate diphosphatase [Pelotomaculum sp. PtaB.Bin117]